MNKKLCKKKNHAKNQHYDEPLNVRKAAKVEGTVPAVSKWHRLNLSDSTVKNCFNLNQESAITEHKRLKIALIFFSFYSFLRHVFNLLTIKRVNNSSFKLISKHLEIYTKEVKRNFVKGFSSMLANPQIF